MRFTNTSDSVVDTHLLIVVRGLSNKIRLNNQSGTTRAGEPYIRVFLEDGVLQPGAQITQRFELHTPKQTKPSFQLQLLSGQGNP